MSKVGIAFGGGGVAGYAHLGVLLALEEAGIEFYCMAGTSSGAIIAALYAYGYSTKQLIDMVPQISEKYLDYDYQTFIAKLMLRKVKFQGLVKGKRLYDLLLTLTKGAEMKDLSFPVACMSTDLKHARSTIFSSRQKLDFKTEMDIVSDIKIANAVLASCCIPILFQPVMHEDRILVDGGLIDNCPIATARALGADLIIGVDLIFAEPLQTSLDSILSIIERVISMNLAMQAKHLTTEADVLIRPDVGHIGALDFSQSDRCIEFGYEYTYRKINEIKEALKQESPSITPYFAARSDYNLEHLPVH